MHNLRRHQKIAFDLDGTLVDGAASAQIAEFIKQHPDKTYFIVTFRTLDQCSTVPTELENVGLKMAMFARMIPLPKTIALEFEEDQRMRRASRLPSLDKVEPKSMLPGEFRFVHWKGFICMKVGATALVDDMPELSRPGCAKYRIDLQDPIHFAGEKKPVAA